VKKGLASGGERGRKWRADVWGPQKRPERGKRNREKMANQIEERSEKDLTGTGAAKRWTQRLPAEREGKRRENELGRHRTCGVKKNSRKILICSRRGGRGEGRPLKSRSREKKKVGRGRSSEGEGRQPSCLKQCGNSTLLSGVVVPLGHSRQRRDRGRGKFPSER